MHLGCIADDFTGATDLASNLVRSGMRVVQINGVPTAPLQADVDAVVVALKSRTTPVEQAVRESLAALQWLQAQGARRFYQKVCSTFDSTAQGNIGPVAQALMAALNAPFAMACPAFPENGRTVFKGHLFVGDLLLSDSPMRHHPLTPMLDANLVRVLQAQGCPNVGLIQHSDVARGTAAVLQRMAALQSEGCQLAIADAVNNADLMTLGAAVKDQRLVIAGSGVAIGLPQNFGITPSDLAAKLPAPKGLRAIISGSCSAASNAQVRHFIEHGGSAFRVDALALAAGDDVVAQALRWARTAQTSHSSRNSSLNSSRNPSGNAALLIYATATPEAVREVQSRWGAQAAGELIERALAAIALGLVRELGVRQLVVAGGETSGACVQALGATHMRIGAAISPGVPWCFAGIALDGVPGETTNEGIHLALKSGNFGEVDFFTQAFVCLH